MKFCYWIPKTDGHVEALETNLGDRYWLNWMQSMVDLNPDTIFFFATTTTDINEDDFMHPKERAR